MRGSGLASKVQLQFPPMDAEVTLPGFEGDRFRTWAQVARVGGRGLEGGSSFAEILGLDTLRTDWDHGLAELRGHLDEHSILTLNLKSTSASGYPIGKWLHHRFHGMQQGYVSDEHIASLEALPGWPNPCRGFTDITYHRRVAQMREFLVERNRMPYSDEQYEGSHLGEWVNRLRRRHEKGEVETWIIEAVEALPGWQWNLRPEPKESRPNEPFNERWMVGYEEAVRWMETHDDIPRSRKNAVVTESGFELTKWMNANVARVSAGTISDEHRALLKAIGLDATPAILDFWRRLPELRAYLDEHHLSDNTMSSSLRQWVNRVRKKDRQGQVPDDVRAELDGLERWYWDAESVKADPYRRAIKAILDAHGEGHFWLTEGGECAKLREWLRRYGPNHRAMFSALLWEHWDLDVRVQRQLWNIKHHPPSTAGYPTLAYLAKLWRSGTMHPLVREAAQGLPGFVAWAESLAAAPNAISDRIAALVTSEPGRTWKAAEIKKALGIKGTTWTHHANRAVESGLIEKVSKGKYRAVPNEG